MSAGDSVVDWLDRLRNGDPAAAQPLRERYFVRLARGRLSGLRRGADDEEDVALSAFKSFCLAVDFALCGGRRTNHDRP
jgi:hypothetical protein